jgi:phage-related tail fiber protein
MADALVPVPDPTFLTTEQLSRGLTNLRELLEARINAVEEAAHHRYEDLRRVPTETDRQVVHLKELFNEKLTSVQKQFDERDIRSQASEDAAKVAVNAALQAQKEAASAQNDSNAAAITKSEAATIKQIDGILALLNSNTIGTNDKITTINARLDRGDGVTKGGHDIRSESRLDTGTMVAIISVAVMAVSVAAGLFGFALHH